MKNRPLQINPHAFELLRVVYRQIARFIQQRIQQSLPLRLLIRMAHLLCILILQALDKVVENLQFIFALRMISIDIANMALRHLMQRQPEAIGDQDAANQPYHQQKQNNWGHPHEARIFQQWGKLAMRHNRGQLPPALCRGTGNQGSRLSVGLDTENAVVLKGIFPISIALGVQHISIGIRQAHSADAGVG